MYLRNYRFWPVIMKRFLDAVLSLALIVVFSPIYGVITFAIWCSMGPPAIFRQERAGLFGKPFTIYKFRTMAEKRNDAGGLLPDSERVTPVGRFLRSTSLDELPQLVNVLKGEMSFIGPRPLPVRYLSRYTATQMRRHEVKPGIAGYAATKGRSDQSWEDILEHDVWYVDHRSILLDLLIAIQILRIVIKREGVGISADGLVSEFMGSSAKRTPEDSENALDHGTRTI